MSVLAQQIAVGIALVLLWALGDALTVFNPDVLPPVHEVARQFIAVWWQPDFLAALFATLRDAILGVLAAALFAIPLGLVIGMFAPFERSTRTLLDFGRSFPVVALLPILVLLIGANSLMKTVTIAIACFFPILLQTIYGARRLEPTIVDTVRSFRIPFRLRFFRVILPAALPYIATGLRIATAVSILVAVGTEVILPITGLGRSISLARVDNQVAVAFAYVIYAGLLGVVLTGLWELAEDRLLAWHRRAKAE
jgi:NitT/TauT family transport system permease protein